jgi:hypothetical protein
MLFKPFRLSSIILACLFVASCASSGYGENANPIDPTTITLKEASFSMANLRPGETIDFSADVGSTDSASDVIVQFILYDKDNIAVFKQHWEGQSLENGQPLTYNVSWEAPPLQYQGEYAGSIGVFDARWQLIKWFDRVTTFTLGGTAQAAESGPIPLADLTLDQNLVDLLPKHFGLGVKADRRGDLGWMDEVGAPFDYRYGYLAGGVNTGSSWAEWSSPRGSYAYRFLTSSDDKGYVPILSYYQIVQSRPNAGQEPPYNNLINPETMRAYFEDWILLMETVGDFGKPTIVHHEPDLWGFLQRKNEDPALGKVAVGSTGIEELAGMEDNARGLAQALVKLRNIYAPNAILAWHATQWATGPDLTIQDVEGKPMGEKLAAYFNKLEAPFDMIFFGPSDRDAAWRQIRRNHDAWWDEADHVRFYDFIKAVLDGTDRKGMIWQIPLGNTIYRTVNNSPWHFQDNHVEYFLLPENRQNVIDHAEIGIVGLLFGGGFREQSSFRDVAEDGITNPEPINGNVKVAEHADDDGGLLRLTSKAFYEQPLIGLR